MRFTLAFLASLLIGSAAYAQTPVAVQQSTQRIDAATFLQGQANGATSCNTVSQTAANDTVTITPPGGQFVYITEVYIENTTDATGVTQTETISSTNLTGAPFWNVGSALTTVQGIPAPQVETFPAGLKSAAAGVAVTFVPSATQSAHNYLCMHVAGYFGP